MDVNLKNQTLRFHLYSKDIGHSLNQPLVIQMYHLEQIHWTQGNYYILFTLKT